MSDANDSGFEPTVPNKLHPPPMSPHAMVWIPGGEFSMGAQNTGEMNDVGMKAALDSRPVHRVYVDGFFMDKTDVTNRQFAEFVRATGYVTVAERKPDAKDFPRARFCCSVPEASPFPFGDFVLFFRFSLQFEV